MQAEANLRATLAAGTQHSIFIDGEGRLFSSGNGLYLETDEIEVGEDLESEEALAVNGLLGHGEGVTRLNTPTRLPSMGGERAVSVSAGAVHSLAIAADGSVWSWGCACRLGHGDDENQLQPKKIEAFTGQRVVTVSAGSNHSLAITVDGAVWTWGLGGCPLGTSNNLLPKKIESMTGRRVVAVSADLMHSLAITTDGGVWSWGEGRSGVLGHGDREDQLLPKKIEAFEGERVTAVSAQNNRSVAVTADGAVWSWGLLGHGDEQRQLLPKKIEGLAGQHVVAVSAGAFHNLALTADGAVWSWGWGDHGWLGHGDDKNQPPKKVQALAGQRVVAVSAGGDHSLARTADGAVWSWGYGGHGLLGHGDEQNQLLPKKIEGWVVRPTPKKRTRASAASPKTAGV